MRDLFKMKVTLRVKPNLPSLSRNLAVAIYRLIQEGIYNAARHSQAEKVSVSLQYDRKHVIIKIVDNGIGFDPARLAELMHKQSFGLLGMQERVSLIGGEFVIRSLPGQGAQIRISLPITTC
jgi:two-component system sensor histidine kinase DegS